MQARAMQLSPLPFSLHFIFIHLNINLSLSLSSSTSFLLHISLVFLPLSLTLIYSFIRLFPLLAPCMDIFSFNRDSLDMHSLTLYCCYCSPCRRYAGACECIIFQLFLKMDSAVAVLCSLQSFSLSINLCVDVIHVFRFKTRFLTHCCFQHRPMTSCICPSALAFSCAHCHFPQVYPISS